MKVLLDTNVLVSAILFGGGPRAILREAIGGDLQLVTSPPLLDELEELLERKFGFPAIAARETRMEIERLAEVVTPVEVPAVARDPDDDEVLAAAVAGRARTIVTGDQDLLALGSYRSIPIVGPADFAAGRA